MCSRVSMEKLCSDCKRWQSLTHPSSLQWNYSIYKYNYFMKELVAKWKYRGDYTLGVSFQSIFQEHFKVHFNHLRKSAIAVPIPLSHERLKERGFNQAQMLTEFLPIESCSPLERLHGEKQSKKTKKERITGGNPFKLKETIKKQVILVDDIYTTGATLHQAARLLIDSGCPAVYSYTLIRG
ncbi:MULTISPECIES: phosphoribosyltransferase family protein [unclassified Virgibacillus]|uniref:ComF family protein n=1 Tax=unclassified Virgibacillus TaxID=2620237 RepID=UPI0024DE8FCB|nr:phosphoribosyltransferase family protein [Virgibacillus sp. LDC-1]